MSLVDIMSFDYIDTAGLTAAFFTGVTGGGQTIATAPAEYPDHANIFHIASSSARWNWKTLAGTPTTIVLGISFSIQSNASGGTDRIDHLELYKQGENTNTASPKIWVYTTHDSNNLTLSINGSDVASTTIANATRYYLILRAEIGVTATVEAYLNGVSFASTVTDTTPLATSFGSYSVGIYANGGASGAIVDYSDLVVYDDTSELSNMLTAGSDVQVWGLLPTADSGSSSWVGSAPGPHYALVNEVPADGATSYVDANAGFAIFEDAYTTAAFPANRLILGTKVDLYATSAGTSIKVYYAPNGGSPFQGAGLVVAGGLFIYVSEVLEINTDTGNPWLDTEINGIAFGPYDYLVPAISVSQAVLEVAHYPSLDRTINGVGQASTYASGTATVTRAAVPIDALLNYQSGDTVADDFWWFVGPLPYKGAASITGGAYSIVAAGAEFSPHTRVLEAASADASAARINIAADITPPVLLVGISFSLQVTTGTNGRINHLELFNQVSGTPVIWVYTTHDTHTLTLSLNGADEGTSAACAIGDRHYLLLRGEFGASATISAWLDGVQFATFTGDTTALGVSFGGIGVGVKRGAAGAGPTVDYSDYVQYAGDAQQATLVTAGSDVQVWGFLPTGDGIFSTWDPSTPGPHFSLVNEVPPDDNTSYVENTGGGAIVDFYTADPLVNRTILGVSANYWVEGQGGGGGLLHTELYLPSSSSTYTASPFDPILTGAYYTQGVNFEVSPFTSLPWTSPEFTEMQVGQSAETGDSTIRVSQVSLEVIHIFSVEQFIDGVGQASTYASGLASITATQNIRGFGQVSTYASGTAMVYTSSIPTPVAGGVGPLWVNEDYTVSGVDNRTLTFLVQPLPTESYVAYYALVDVIDPVHATFFERKDDWSGGEDTWTLQLPYIPGTLQVYVQSPLVITGVGQPSTYASGTAEVTVAVPGNLWVSYSESDGSSQVVRLGTLTAAPDPVTLTWEFAPIAVPSETINCMTSVTARYCYVLSQTGTTMHLYKADAQTGSLTLLFTATLAASQLAWQVYAVSDSVIYLLVGGNVGVASDRLYYTTDGGSVWHGPYGTNDPASSIYEPTGPGSNPYSAAAMTVSGSTVTVLHSTTFQHISSTDHFALLSSGIPGSGFTDALDTSSTFWFGGDGYLWPNSLMTARTFGAVAAGTTGNLPVQLPGGDSNQLSMSFYGQPTILVANGPNGTALYQSHDGGVTWAGPLSNIPYNLNSIGSGITAMHSPTVLPSKDWGIFVPKNLTNSFLLTTDYGDNFTVVTVPDIIQGCSFVGGRS